MADEEETFNVLRMPPKIPIDNWYAEYCELLYAPSNGIREWDTETAISIITDFLYKKGWKFSEIFKIENNEIVWYRPY